MPNGCTDIRELHTVRTRNRNSLLIGRNTSLGERPTNRTVSKTESVAGKKSKGYTRHSSIIILKRNRTTQRSRRRRIAGCNPLSATFLHKSDNRLTNAITNTSPTAHSPGQSIHSKSDLATSSSQYNTASNKNNI